MHLARSQSEISNDLCNVLILTCRAIVTRERRRSRSICGPLFPMETAPGSPISLEGNPLVPPAVGGTLATSTPSPRPSHVPRRRRHSCVAPNTKEFHTLATIFGWVTLSCPNIWSDRSHSQHKDAHEPDVCPLQDYADNHTIASESDGDPDLDGVYQHSDMVEWNTVLDSR